MIAIVDYNIGNVRSVQKAVERAAADAGSQQEVVLTGDPATLLRADGVILPGVGAFGACVTNLRQAQLSSVVREVVVQGTPLLGICVGMQMLFEFSEEMGAWRGLGLLPGRVRRFEHKLSTLSPPLSTLSPPLRVPQIGWNQLHPIRPDPLLASLGDGAFAYFVHSFYCDAADPADVLATTDYGISYASVVQHGHIWGIQCHPEKSQQVGLRILRNFVAMTQT